VLTTSLRTSGWIGCNIYHPSALSPISEPEIDFHGPGSSRCRLSDRSPKFLVEKHWNLRDMASSSQVIYWENNEGFSKATKQSVPTIVCSYSLHFTQEKYT
jgi:hypothetical protein